MGEFNVSPYALFLIDVQFYMAERWSGLGHVLISLPATHLDLLSNLETRHMWRDYPLLRDCYSELALRDKNELTLIKILYGYRERLNNSVLNNVGSSVLLDTICLKYASKITQNTLLSR